MYVIILICCDGNAFLGFLTHTFCMVNPSKKRAFCTIVVIDTLIYNLSNIKEIGGRLCLKKN